MEQNQTQEKVSLIVTWVARFLAILAIIAFFIPFCTVSCSGHEIAKISMKDMMTGKEVYSGSSNPLYSSGSSNDYEEKGDAEYVLCLLLPAAAIGLSFLKKPIVKAITYLLDGITMLILCGNAMETIEKACNAYNCTSKKVFGYVLYQFHGWLMIVLAAIGIIVYMLYQRQNSTSKNSSAEQVSPVKMQTVISSNRIICQNCGKENEMDFAYCKYCGKELKKTEMEIKEQSLLQKTLEKAGRMYMDSEMVEFLEKEKEKLSNEDRKQIEKLLKQEPQTMRESMKKML